MTQILHCSMIVRVTVLAAADVTLIQEKARLSPSSHVKHVRIGSNPQMCQLSNTNKLFKLKWVEVKHGKTLLGIHHRQEAFPETLPTSSFITRVFPVPQAISIFLAPFAQASKQSCWHFLNGGSEGVASSWMPVLEAALLATSLPEKAGGCHMLPLFTATRNNKYSQGAEQFETVDETL